MGASFFVKQLIRKYKEEITSMKRSGKITEIAVATALAVVLHFVKIFTLPQGGDISLGMVPIIFVAYRRGAASGMCSGVLYGLITLVTDGTIYHPMSVVLDYIAAFGILGVAGFFPKSIVGMIAGTTVSVGGRFVCSFLSGALIFGSYAPEGQNPWIYSFVYQATYLIPELLICVAVMILLYVKAPKLFEAKR